MKDDAGEPPDWAASWLTARTAKVGHVPAREPAEPKDPKTAAKRAEQREARVATGLAELDRWLCDQVRQGLAASQQAGYGHWDDIAARMVDAQAPGPAERLRALASVPHSGAGWDGRLLEEYALLRLLAVAYRRQAELPPPLRETVRSRIGFSLRQADVLAGGHAGPGPLAGAGPPGPRAGPDPDPPDMAAGPQDRPARARAQLRPGRPGARRHADASAPRPTPTWSSTPAPSRCAPSC